MNARRATGETMREGDYVSDEFVSLDLDHAFPNMISGLPPTSPWPWWDPGVAEGFSHRWYSDSRVEMVGFATRDEAAYIHACARLMRGRPALEIGCFMAWTAAHMASGGVQLDVIDPWLDGFVGESVRQSLEALGLTERINLIQDSSPNAVISKGRTKEERWALALIDGDHEAPTPLADAVTVAQFMAGDAIILFHDVNLPSVGAALDTLQFLGWSTMVLQTTFGLGVAWRGKVVPPRHIPDPSVNWRPLAHLHRHAISPTAALVAGSGGSVPTGLHEPFNAPPALGAALTEGDFRMIQARCAPVTAVSEERLRNLFDGVQDVVEKGVPGAFVECGVWRGGCLMAICETLARLGARDRDVFAFDTFAGMTEPTEADRTVSGEAAADLMEREADAKETGVWCYADLASVRRNVGTCDYPMEKLHFVQGPVETTTPHHGLQQIALLRLDTDFYESTKHELEVLVPLVAPGGWVIIDDYGHWQGCRKAVDEWLQQQHVAGCQIELTEIDFTGRYFVVQ